MLLNGKSVTRHPAKRSFASDAALQKVATARSACCPNSNNQRWKYNIHVILVSLSLILMSVHGTSKTSASLNSTGLALVNSTLGEAEKKMVRMGLKRTHIIYQAKASWYGAQFHGKTTANMETFDRMVLSAAHKTLPLNTYLLVTNLNNGKKVVVRVNDRGPYIEGRDLDLSEAAARLVGSYAKGVVPVRFEVLESV